MRESEKLIKEVVTAIRFCTDDASAENMARAITSRIVERCAMATRTALIDAAHLYRGTPDSSAMFKAETLATNAIYAVAR